MRFSSVVPIMLSLALAASAIPAKKNSKNNNAATAASDAAASPSATTAGGDQQASTTLDPQVIATGFANNGQDVQEAGQVPSLTSSNNFINFCLTQANLPITNGKQITTGSCNPAPMGALPSSNNMPSSKFVFPKNGEVIQTGTNFTIQMAVLNLELGNFVNAQENYFAAPQQIDSSGNIIGHTHFTIDTLPSLDSTTPTDPTKPAFFKGVNTPAVNGVVSVVLDKGLPAGFYRLASINAAANHQPVLVPIAQHGSLDDMVYFTVSDDGAASANATVSSSAAAASASDAGATAPPAASGSVKAKGGKGKNGKGVPK